MSVQGQTRSACLLHFDLTVASTAGSSPFFLSDTCTTIVLSFYRIEAFLLSKVCECRYRLNFFSSVSVFIDS